MTKIEMAQPRVNVVESTMHKKHRGSHSEIIACAWLLSQGFEVFRNISQHGFCDIVAVNPESMEVIYIDVKTMDCDGWLALRASAGPLKFKGFCQFFGQLRADGFGHSLAFQKPWERIAARREAKVNAHTALTDYGGLIIKILIVTHAGNIFWGDSSKFLPTKTFVKTPKTSKSNGS